MHNGEITDIKSWLKETAFDDERRFNQLKESLVNKRVLDFGCGVADRFI
jgi:hypothetical protein